MALSPRDRNAVIVLGVIVVAALAFFFLFMGGGDEPDDAAPTVPPPTSLPEPTPEPTAGAQPRRFNFFGGRDPFLPLVVADEGTGGSGTADATTGGTGTGTGTGTGGTVDEPDQDAEQDAQGDDGATTQVGGHTVTLVDIIDGDTAQISIDGETFTVDEGEDFGDNFRLLSVSGGCARILHGDESFTLCEGGERK